MDEKMQQNVAAVLAAQQQQGRLSNLAKSLVAAFAEIPAGVVKDANNPHFGNDYATLEAVEQLVKPILAKHKLAFIQTPGAIVGETIEIIGMLIHESGENLVFKTAMAVSKQRSKKGDDEGGKLTAQSVGSAITYGRRYQLMAVFGLAPVDDDGEAASGSDYEPAAREPRRTRKPAKQDDDGYADAKANLESAISDATSYELLEKNIRPLVEEFGDADLNAKYVEKRRQLKAAAKGAK